MIGGSAGAVGVGVGAVVLSWAGVLTVADLRCRRLPDWLTLPAIAVTWLLAVWQMPMALLGGIAWSLLYLFLALWRGGIGGGDVKLAASLGVLVVWVGGAAALLLAMVAAALISLVAALATRSAAVAHGPAMLLAGAIGGAAGAALP